MTSFIQRAPRVVFQKKISLIAEHASGLECVEAQASNISPQGIAIRSPQAVAVGSLYQVVLHAGGRQLPFVMARAIWSRRTNEYPQVQVGLRFVEALHPRAFELAQVLAQRTAPAFTPQSSAYKKVTKISFAAVLIALLSLAVLFGVLAWPSSQP